MHAVVTSFGSAGDFNPLLAIAARLARDGADVTFVANPFYAERVTRVGCRFVGAGERVDVFAALEANPRYLDPRTGAMAIFRDLVAPSIRETYPVVRDTVGELGASVVVSNALSFGGCWAAEATGVNSVVVTPTPFAWLSRHSPVTFADWRAPRPLQGWLTVALRGLLRLALGRPLARLARSLGAPVDGDAMLASARRAQLNLGLWPDWLRAAAPDDPPRAATCGFVFDADGAAPVDAELQRFLDTGEAPVVVAFGSAASLHGADRYRALARACAQLRRRCVLIGAPRDLVRGEHVCALPSAPYARVFPHAAAIVHHGGFGTCAEALRAGKPSLVTPFAFDQFDVAARVEDAGFGFWLRRGAARPAVVAAALERTLASAPAAAAAFAAGQRIAAEADGASRAAELIRAL